MAGEACQRAVLCLAQLVTIMGVGMISDFIDQPLATTIAKTVGNGAGLLFTGPAYGVDSISLTDYFFLEIPWMMFNQ